MNTVDIFALIDKNSLQECCMPCLSCEIARRIIEDVPHIERYCTIYSTKLSKIVFTNESDVLEPMYIFNDNTGGYTIDGVKASL